MANEVPERFKNCKKIESSFKWIINDFQQVWPKYPAIEPNCYTLATQQFRKPLQSETYTIYDETFTLELLKCKFLLMMKVSQKEPYMRSNVWMIQSDKHNSVAATEAIITPNVEKQSFLPVEWRYFVESSSESIDLRCTSMPESYIAFDKTTRSSLEIDIKVSAFIERKFDKKSQSKILLDYEKLLTDGVLADVVFSIDGQKLRAHKNILSARSDVFAAMFKHNMIENKENCVKIYDVGSEAFTDLLHFIYSGKLKTSLKDIYEMLAIAEKYGVPDLKTECGETMVKMLSIENASKTLLLANFYNLTMLQKTAVDFFKKNVKEIIKTADWNDSFKKMPRSLLKLLF